MIPIVGSRKFSYLYFFIIYLFVLGFSPFARAEGESKASILRAIAEEYVKSVKKWQPNTYILNLRGKWNEHNVVTGYLIEDRIAAQKRAEEEPDVVRMGHYPSEFMLLIDYERRKVVKEIRPEKEPIVYP